MHHSRNCPACHRPFKSAFDYPAIEITGFERLPIPEAIDDMSAAAAEKRLMAMRKTSSAPYVFGAGGINMTPAIEQACRKPPTQEYLVKLSTLVGQKVRPESLLPPTPPDQLFRRAYPIEGTGIYISLDDVEANEAVEPHLEVGVYCEGPNLGSAGGPTLQRLGAIAIVRYEGLLGDSAVLQS